MAAGERAEPVQVDLEKELTCSICTDLLYQPLTLLDCLHTFCGACLKEWFAFQASTATSLHPYTCPSCRASVRSTQPNATVTTLLDMFIHANPGRGKSEHDRQQDREKYRPGDNVLPKLRRREDPGADEEQRMLEEAQQLSLQQAGIPNAASNSTLEPPRERRRREPRSRDASRESRRSRDDRRSTSRNPSGAPPPSEAPPPRVIEHQSSLRSLLSASELDSQEMEEEIMRQIMEEGLLDGIDLNNIDVAQEDEISERIAQAYRRRQTERQRERRERRERLAREAAVNTSATSTPPERRSPPTRDEDPPRRRGHTSSESAGTTPVNASRPPPPVSRPGLIDAANQGVRTHRRRSSSQGSSRSARRAERPTALSASRPANPSQSEAGDRPTTSDSAPPARRRQSDNPHRGALEDRQQFRRSLQTSASSNPNSPRLGFNGPTTESPTSSVAVVASPMNSPPNSTPTSAPPANPYEAPTSRRTTDPAATREPRPTNNGTPPMTSAPHFPRSTTDPTSHSRHSSATALSAPVLFAEPHISCDRCGKPHIEYELHYNCSRCDSGAYNLCLGCYRNGKGCKHWFGFGRAAWPRYERLAPPGGYPANHEHPHTLIGRRYRRPLAPLTESTEPPHTLMSEDDPMHRLETGVFCDICRAYANACYWKCDTCNQGAWGFCNDCVNQGRHCTHPILPVAQKIRDPPSSAPDPITSSPSSPPPLTISQAAPLSPGLAPPNHDSGPTTPPLTPKSASLIRGPGLITIANAIFRPLTFTCVCNICTYPIPPSRTRYHCQKCNMGDYDICMSCYHKLVVSGRVSKEDGMNGWRRCLRSHRMIVVGFEDRESGQRRIVVKDLVGGFALLDDDNTESRSPTTHLPPPRERGENWSWRDHDGTIQRYRSPTSSSSTMPPVQQRFPPDGGVGLRVQALWSYFPADGVKDELAFPRNAEIREAEDINGDWFWGVYAGSKGLFPGNYGRIIGGGVERLGVI